MTTFTIEVKDQGVREALNALAARSQNLRPVLLTIGEDIQERAKRRFETSTGPDGQRWKANARSTIEAFIAGKGGFGKRGINQKGRELAISKKPLIGDSRDLSRQFHVAASGNSVTIGNTMTYAAIQQFGGQAGRGKKVTIPARPFLPVMKSGEPYPAERQRIIDQINDYLAGK